MIRPIRFVLLVVLSPLFLLIPPLLLASWLTKQKRKRSLEREETEAERRDERMRAKVLATEVTTEWTEAKCRDFGKWLSALQKALSETVYDHHLRARVCGSWTFDLTRRLPVEMKGVFSTLSHLTVSNRILPTIGNMQSIGGELHLNPLRLKVQSDDSYESLIERAYLRHLSGQLYLYWHALYDREQLCFSLDDFLLMGDRHSWSGKEVYERQFDDVKRARMAAWPFLPRTGLTAEGEKVVEYLTVKPYRPSGILLHRAVFDPKEPYGICDAVVDRIPFCNFLNF